MQKEYEGIIKQATAEHNLGREEIEKLLSCDGQALDFLFAAADQVR